MLYKLPLEYPSDLPVTELRDLLNKHSVKLEYNFDADFDDPENHTLTGTEDSLANFFSDMDGPGQSFPIVEFLEYIQDYKLV